MQRTSRAPIRFYEDSNFGKSDRRFYEDRVRSGRVTTAAGLVLDLAVVADGIGGENAGERAAEMTIDEVFENATSSHERNIPLLLQNAVEFANAKVYLEAQNERHKRDMGSTVVVAAIHDRKLYIANVGDSRIYLLRGRELCQLTVDHTWANEMVKEGSLTPEEAARHPRRDELMRSIGYEPQVMVDLGLFLDGDAPEKEAQKNQGLPLRRGDRILLCSDGLFKARRRGGGHFVEPAEMVEILSESPGDEATRLLVDKALERKTDDNVSVALMEVPDARQAFRFPKAARIAFGGILALGLIVIAYLIFSPGVTTLASDVQINTHQVYVAEIKGLDFQFLPQPDQPTSAAKGDYLEFLPGALLLSGNEEGYIFIGLPGRAELFIGPESEVELVSSDSTGVVIQLNEGHAILNLPDEFPPERSVTVRSAAGARTWINGSKMCLSYDSSQELLRLDCVEDRCLYQGQKEKELPAGYHVIFAGKAVTEVGLGLQPEACQFVPDMVPTSTATATASPTLKVNPTATNLTPSVTATHPRPFSTVTRVPPTATRRQPTEFVVPSATNTRLAPPSKTPIPTTVRPDPTTVVPPPTTAVPPTTEVPPPTTEVPTTEVPPPTTEVPTTEVPVTTVAPPNTPDTPTPAVLNPATPTPAPADGATSTPALISSQPALALAPDRCNDRGILDGKSDPSGCDPLGTFGNGPLDGGFMARFKGYFLVQFLSLLAIILLPMIVVVRTVRERI